MFRKCCNIVVTSFFVIWNALFLRRRLNSDQYRKTSKISLSTKRLLTTLADRRRAGPPAFRRKYSQLPNATLSLLLGGPGFFPTFSAARGRDPVAASLMENLLIKNAGKKCDFGNEPIELAENLHVFRYEQANQQSLLAFFRIFS